MAEQSPQPQERREQHRIESFGDTVRKDGRETNEDAILVHDELRLYGVFDGMGGHGAGEVASVTARDACLQDVVSWDDLGDDDIENLAEYLGNVLYSANKAVIEKAQEAEASDDEEVQKGQNMGTTASIVKIHETADGTVYAGVATIGDSPVYVWRQAEHAIELVPGTDDMITDDTWARIAFERGPDAAAPTSEERESARTEVRNALNKDQLSAPAKFLWDRRNVVSQALGTPREKIKPHTALVTLGVGDAILVMTDGVSDNIQEQGEGGIAAVAGAPGSNKQKGRVLLNGALIGSRQPKEKNFRAKPDDMSVVVISVT